MNFSRVSGWASSISLFHSSSSGLSLDVLADDSEHSGAELHFVECEPEEKKKINKIKDIMNLLNLPAPLKDDLKMKAMRVNWWMMWMMSLMSLMSLTSH